MKTEKKIKIFYVGTWKSTRLGTREDTVNKTKEDKQNKGGREPY